MGPGARCGADRGGTHHRLRAGAGGGQAAEPGGGAGRFPEQGHYFRSDHFSFAHAGIPAFSVGTATNFAGKPEGWADKAYNAYTDNNYHQPSDEFHADWDFTALEQAAQFGYILGSEIANQEGLPGWRPGDQFKRK